MTASAVDARDGILDALRDERLDFSGAAPGKTTPTLMKGS
jgi:hypothetical protein